MFRNIIGLAGVVAGICIVVNLCGAVQVEGYCFLENQTNYEGTFVLFSAVSPSAVTDSTWTDSAGYFLVDLNIGLYNVNYSHSGFMRYLRENQSFFSATTLPNVLLRQAPPGVLLAGPLQGELIDTTYIVIDHISIPVGWILIINDGATLLFWDIMVVPQFQIMGTLRAQGSSQDSIRFLPYEGSSWGGLNFSGSASDSSIIEYCVIGGSIGNGISFSWGSSPSMHHSTISNNANSGVGCSSYSHPSLTYCDIVNNISSGGGGGIWCGPDTYPILNDCLIADNYANGGGGVFLHAASPIFYSCSISRNSSMGGGIGGGIYGWGGANPSFFGCTIQGNYAQGDAGGSNLGYFDNCSIINNIAGGDIGGVQGTCNNCVISGNVAHGVGGGVIGTCDSCQIMNNIAFENGGGVCANTITHCTISGNTAINGGGVYGGVVSNCTISNNSASNDGGGIYSSSEVNQSVIYDNNANNNGGGIWSCNNIDHCTIALNTATVRGGGIYEPSANAEIYNSIISNNSGGGITFMSSANCSLTYCDLYANSGGNLTGTPPTYVGQIVTTNINSDSSDIFMNIFENPLFVNAGGGDFQLQEYSPCIDAGDPSYPLDPDNTITDIGAFYYDQSYLPFLVVSTNDLEFPLTTLVGQSTLPLVLYNTGSANLVIAQIQIINLCFSTNYLSGDSIIAPDDSLTLTVLFSPDTLGLNTGSLQIISNGGNAQILLSGIGSSPVTIDLEPFYEPIYIYPWGGQIGYYLHLVNNTTNSQTFDLWVDILLPDSTLYGPVITRDNIVIPASGQITRLIMQSVPATAPVGQYVNQGHVSDAPHLQIWSEDSFVFTKVPYYDGAQGESVANWSTSGWDNIVSATIPVEEIYPSEFALHPPSPNPFNLSTAISYKLQASSHVTLQVYDTAGRLVATLVNGYRDAGAHAVTFDGANLPSGVYLYRLEAGEYHAVGKMVLLK